MKLRLLFTILIPALCGAFEIEMRGMEQAKQLSGSTRNIDDFIPKTQEEINFKKNLAITENLDAINAALNDIRTDYTYELANSLVKIVMYNFAEGIGAILDKISTRNQEMTYKKTALFFLTVFLRENDTKSQDSLCQSFLHGCDKTDPSHHEQLIGCYKKIFEYTGKKRDYFVLGYIRKIMFEAMRNKPKSLTLLKEAFTELNDSESLEDMPKETLSQQKSNRKPGNGINITVPEPSVKNTVQVVTENSKNIQSGTAETPQTIAEQPQVASPAKTAALIKPPAKKSLLAQLKSIAEKATTPPGTKTENSTPTLSDLGSGGMYVLKDTAEEQKALPPIISKHKKPTIETEIQASHPTQQKSSWKPAIVTTAVVAGFGAACWYQWNTVKAVAQQYVPESVANIFARFRKGFA